ncbi:MAG: hypothetical protein AAGJ08_01065 [Cyanobacteria bacterium P01_H01_bin.35]
MTGYNQQSQSVRNQVNINLQPPGSPDPLVLLKQGIELLEGKSYNQAIEQFRVAIQVDSSLTTTYYYLALALLKGKRPKILQRNQIEEIDGLLCAATKMGDSDGTVQWFRALIRDDYYGGNRMRCPEPNVSEIISSIRVTDINRLKMLLKRLPPMFDNPLYCELVKQIFKQD